ncbi:transforming growth factor beta-1-induced transcript 1 protein isoform X2 [Spea bombifrons]|nr:transforming growth factor beta-1-induced transcript 1 protein isoform X2 [Spea bombifrons]XP_053327775.1 transforming growth factor beta-1-induced transcript 1 protein isoform X2 [Spea bombifrons]
MSNMTPDPENPPGGKEHLYSTVQKSPLTPVAPVVGGGLCELDRLLNELNATQFSIADEILAQFPSGKKTEFQKDDDRRTLSASSATQELDRLMASLSDFHKQNTGSFAPQDLIASRAEMASNPKIPQGEIEGLQDTSGPQHHGVQCNAGAPQEAVTLKTSEDASDARGREGISCPKPSEDSSSPKTDLDSMMVKLQSGLKLQGIETQSKGLCQSCHRPIAGQVVTALGHAWHPEHFVCAHCHTMIGSTNFFEKDGQPYCERDYFALHAPRCSMCDLPILQNMVTALGRTWHPEHFCCRICKKQIGEEGFHEKDGVQYCSEDYFRLFGAVCAGCSEPVKESYISALGGLWHPHCFVCHVCRTPFINGSFFESDGLPLCETHYHSRRGSLCAGCDQPITGRCVTAMGRKFHPQHLSCTFCLRQLNKGTFREHDGKPYCQACYGRLYG